MRRFAKAALILALLATTVPASAEVLKFHASLTGKAEPDNTGSNATGEAVIHVDTSKRLVSVDLRIHGMTIDKLWDKLVAAPVGPIHFHEYLANGDAVLALPLPFGLGYVPDGDGFRVTAKDYDYVAGARLLKSTIGFDDFVAAMKTGKVILNVHTDAFNDGEIGGYVVAG